MEFYMLDVEGTSLCNKCASNINGELVLVILDVSLETSLPCRLAKRMVPLHSRIHSRRWMEKNA